MQAFIAQKQADLLVRAIDTVRTCPDVELPAQMHRLAGTLGTYQLLMAHDACRDLERIAERADSTADDIRAGRADTLNRLEQIAEDLQETGGNEEGR